MSLLNDLGTSLLGGVQSALGSFGDMAFNAWSADKQMKFQEDMAGTAYQRAAKDLEAAGLNRVLALGSPAAAPAGALAPPVSMGSSVAANRQAATAAKVAEATIENTKMDTMKKMTEAEYIDQQRHTSATQEVLNTAQQLWYMGQTLNLPKTGLEIEARTENYKAQSARERAQVPLLLMQTAQTGELSRKTAAEASQAEVLKAGYELLSPILQSLLERFGNSASSSSSVFDNVIRDFFGRGK